MSKGTPEKTSCTPNFSTESPSYGSSLVMSYDEAFEELTAFLANCQLQFLYCLKMLRQSKEKILWHLY